MRRSDGREVCLKVRGKGIGVVEDEGEDEGEVEGAAHNESLTDTMLRALNTNIPSHAVRLT